MLKNYLKAAYRNLLKHKLFSSLNIFGLAAGMACSILIFLWVQDEKSYDQFNHQPAGIFRVTCKVADVEAAVVPPALAYAIQMGIPSVNRATRTTRTESTIAVGTQKFNEKNIFYADSNFLRIFNYPLLKGSRVSALSSSNNIVLTEAAAKKYFGNIEPIGKTLTLNPGGKGVQLMVTGILKDIPSNSHLHFDMLVSMDQYDRINGPESVWTNFDVFVYFQLKDNIRPTAAVLKNITQQIDGIRKKNMTNVKSALVPQALTDIHLHSHYMLDVDGQGNYQQVNIFSFIAIFIVLIACINFMNLSTAVSGQRAKEVGLRKIMGALRPQLIIQFISESLLLSFISLMLAIGMVLLLLPLFNQLAFKSVSLNLFDVKLLGGLLAIAVTTGLLSGSYPAFFLSSFNPVKALKGVKLLQNNKSFFRSGLVVLQFSISVVLIIATIVVYQQLQYIRDRNIGFNKENLLYMALPDIGAGNAGRDVLQAELRQNAGIKNFTFTDNLPTNLSSGSELTWPGMAPGTQVIAYRLRVDEKFIETFGIKLSEGNFFSGDNRAGDTGYVVNETTLRVMHIRPEEAIGKKISISLSDHLAPIIGVVKDFNFKPVQQPVEPLVMMKQYAGGYAVMRTSPGALQESINALKSSFRNIYGDYPVSFGFIDEDLSKLYQSEMRMGKLLNVFSLLSILISCLGLFGLATFAAQRRIKEIGIRKVLGATETGIVALLSKDFLKLVLISFIVSFPLAWWLMNQWLHNFVYRISIDAWVFVAAGVSALLVAFVTVSVQAIKAAWTNPVKSLRAE